MSDGGAQTSAQGDNEHGATAGRRTGSRRRSHTSGTAASEVVDSGEQRARKVERQSTALSPTRRLLTLPQAATYLGLSPWTVRDLVWKARLPVVRLTRKLLFDLQDLDRLIARVKDRS
jgi:excisionase family DNA binding protein